MEDSVVFLRGAGNLAKTYRGNAEWIGYDSGKWFNAAEVPVTDLDHLHGLLTEVALMRDICIVRGALIGDRVQKNIRRLLHPDCDNGDPATIQDVPRTWLMLDVDRLDLPAGTDPLDLVACARVAVSVLPEQFHKARCIVQASAGHGIKDGIRLHLWFWLDRAVTCADAKRWLRLVNAPVDLSVLQPVQPHYTANPIFAPGIVDPLPARLVWLDGEAFVTVPSIEEPEVDVAAVRSTVIKRTAPLASRLTALMVKLVKTPQGSRHRMIYWTACRLGECVAAEEMTEEAALALICETCSSQGWPNPSHIRITSRDGIRIGKQEAVDQALQKQRAGIRAAHEFKGE